MAGVVVCNKTKNLINDRGRYNFCLMWTADGSGDVPPEALPKIDGYVTLVEVIPGVPAPTSNYDIMIKDPEGIDIMGGGLLDLPADEGRQAAPNVSGKKGDRVVSGQLIFELTGNIVAGAKGKCIIFVQE